MMTNTINSAAGLFKAFGGDDSVVDPKDAGLKFGEEAEPGSPGARFVSALSSLPLNEFKHAVHELDERAQQKDSGKDEPHLLKLYLWNKYPEVFAKWDSGFSFFGKRGVGDGLLSKDKGHNLGKDSEVTRHTLEAFKTELFTAIQAKDEKDLYLLSAIDLRLFDEYMGTEVRASDLEIRNEASKAWYRLTTPPAAGAEGALQSPQPFSATQRKK